jgi:hypothetical protein
MSAITPTDMQRDITKIHLCHESSLDMSHHWYENAVLNAERRLIHVRFAGFDPSCYI